MLRACIHSQWCQILGATASRKENRKITPFQSEDRLQLLLLVAQLAYLVKCRTGLYKLHGAAVICHVNGSPAAHRFQPYDCGLHEAGTLTADHPAIAQIGSPAFAIINHLSNQGRHVINCCDFT